MSKETKARELLIVRSGRTAWDDEGRLQGRSDLPLSESGRSSFVAGLTHALGPDDSAYSLIHHGPDEASKESAALIAKKTGGKTKEIKNFRGMDVGLWDGLLEQELQDRYPTAIRQWQNDPMLCTPPEGETMAALTDRLLGSLLKLVEKPSERPLVVVLRPVGYALLAAILSGKRATDVWKMIQDGPLSARVEVTSDLIRDLLDENKAGV